MAGSSNLHQKTNTSSPAAAAAAAAFDASLFPYTTFVQADPSNFRAVVQKLTGAPPQETLSAQKSAARLAGKYNSGEMGPRRPAFKLHERRQSARKLEIKLNHGPGRGLGSPSGLATVMVSPVSPLELLGRGSPRTPQSHSEEEEMRAITEKGFYLHPSPLSTPRGSEPPPLLPLFPLHSPRNDASSNS